MNKKIVYITGCLGFIGSYITRTCLDRGWYVRGIDKITYCSNIELLKEFSQYSNFYFEKIDINDIPFLYDCDYIINTCAESHVTNSIVNSDEFIHSNICGVHHLLELIRNNRNEQKPIFIQTSSDEVYADILEGYHKETDILKPSNPYSASKSCADMLILAWARTYNIPYIIVRPTNNYGIGQYIEKLIPKTIKYLVLNRKIPLHDGGIPTRNWLHAQDTTDAILTIIESGKRNEIFNIAGHFEQSNLITVEKIIHHFYQDFTLNIQDYIIDTKRPGQDMRYAIDDSKLIKLGWYPKRNFDEELPKIVESYRSKFIW